MTILQELFYGNIFPNNGTFDRNSEYGRVIQLIDGNEAKLLALLNTEKSLFIDFCNAQLTLNNITAEENFIQGFKTGALIIFEVFERRRGI
ncbi:MAG: DUF6809 family protein [Syntrophomonas sp.]